MSDTPITDRAAYAYGMDDTEVVPIEAARQLERMCNELAGTVLRYRNSVPLGHQPHMLAHKAGEFLARWQAMKEQK